jgi:hypothetical protein
MGELHGQEGSPVHSLAVGLPQGCGLRHSPSSAAVDPSNAAALLQTIDMDNMKYVKVWQYHLIAHKWQCTLIFGCGWVVDLAIGSAKSEPEAGFRGWGHTVDQSNAASEVLLCLLWFYVSKQNLSSFD